MAYELVKALDTCQSIRRKKRKKHPNDKSNIYTEWWKLDSRWNSSISKPSKKNSMFTLKPPKTFSKCKFVRVVIGRKQSLLLDDLETKLNNDLDLKYKICMNKNLNILAMSLGASWLLIKRSSLEPNKCH